VSQTASALGGDLGLVCLLDQLDCTIAGHTLCNAIETHAMNAINAMNATHATKPRMSEPPASKRLATSWRLAGLSG
jgi:hypothetical protein